MGTIYLTKVFSSFFLNDADVRIFESLLHLHFRIMDDVSIFGKKEKTRVVFG